MLRFLLAVALAIGGSLGLGSAPNTRLQTGPICDGCKLKPKVESVGFIKFLRVVRTFTEKHGGCCVEDNNCKEEKPCTIGGTLTIQNTSSSTPGYIGGGDTEVVIPPGTSIKVRIGGPAGKKELACGGTPYSISVSIGTFTESITWECMKCQFETPATRPAH